MIDCFLYKTLKKSMLVCWRPAHKGWQKNDSLRSAEVTVVGLWSSTGPGLLFDGCRDTGYNGAQVEDEESMVNATATYELFSYGNELMTDEIPVGVPIPRERD